MRYAKKKKSAEEARKATSHINGSKQVAREKTRRKRSHIANYHRVRFSADSAYPDSGRCDQLSARKS
jgi:hypothetical protein